MPKRKIMYNIVLAREVILAMKNDKKKEGFMGMQLDVSKSFDRVNWTYLMQVINILRFAKWCTMREQCFSTHSMQYCVA